MIGRVTGAAVLLLAGCAPPPPTAGLQLSCATGLTSYADYIRVRSTPDGETYLVAGPQHSLVLQTNAEVNLPVPRGQECVIAPKLYPGGVVP